MLHLVAPSLVPALKSHSVGLYLMFVTPCSGNSCPILCIQGVETTQHHHTKLCKAIPVLHYNQYQLLILIIAAITILCNSSQSWCTNWILRAYYERKGGIISCKSTTHRVGGYSPRRHTPTTGHFRNYFGESLQIVHNHIHFIYRLQFRFIKTRQEVLKDTDNSRTLSGACTVCLGQPSLWFSLSMECTMGWRLLVHAQASPRLQL